MGTVDTTANGLTAAEGPAVRHKPIDGWRGVAASLVVLAHAANYRYAEGGGVAAHYVRRLSGPLAEIGVQLFFVISGFIITSLLIREQNERGGVGIASFYARRVCRILPPLFAYYAVVVVLAAAGYLNLSWASLATSAAFACNTGVVDCQWWVAHTWSLAVEEQFYIVWPLLFTLASARSRPVLLWAALGVGLIGTIAQRPVAHANFTSFACIAAGALVAASPAVYRALQRATQPIAWAACVLLLVVGPLTAAERLVAALLPALIAYVIFAGNGIGWVRALLVSRPLQAVGLASYSVYLWQQLFFARPALYAGPPPPVLLLPLAVVASVLLVERPFIRFGRSLSRRVARPATA